ncbi:MAG TPA: SDR family NAD(P)-dependent oxidoreductase [Solirubrobacterales bacterium]|jgi:NADP-dependent 3-hydroxy acid dehydrogenase YdfG|nr:SDR family NAD(P)-dependent oxidoreductase [Solirubrobacterales bacterium]
MAAPLAGRVVAITGASSGIGEATALALAEAGAKVALAARRADRLEEIVARIEAAGGEAMAIPTDVADEAQANAFVGTAAERFGRLDALVNNAGVMQLGPIEGAPTKEWRRMVDVNVFGVLYCTHAVLPIMREAGGGHIVNVSSVGGKVVGTWSGVYSLTKFGLGAFTEALRRESIAAGIRVTLVVPGSTATELRSHTREEVLAETVQAFAGVTPLDPADIAAAIVAALALPPNVSISEIVVRPSGQGM